MKLSRTVMALLCVSSVAWARPSLTVAKFDDRLIPNSCSLQKKTGADIANEMQRQLTSILANYPNLKVLDGPRAKAGSRYIVSATLKSFENCRGIKPDDDKVKVAIEFRVVDNLTKTQAFTYVSSASATGAGVLAKTARLVLTDIAFRVERALTSRKSTVRIVDKKIQKQIIVQDYKVKLVRRDPARQ